MASYLWRKYADYVYTKWERTILWDMVDPYRRPKSFTPLVTIYITAFYTGVVGAAITEQLYKVREHIASGLGTRRPWMEMIQLQDLSFPTSFIQLSNRIKHNAEFFRMNYILIILFILFLSLLWQPISLVVFIISFLAWLFLYFLREEPWVVRGSAVDDRLVIVALTLITVALLFVTDATKNVIISLFVGAVVVFGHGALKGSEDRFFMDEEDILESGGGRGVIKMPLKHAASSSFSLP